MSVSFVYDFDKALAALVYLASNAETVPAFDKYKAGKLLFLADKHHLVRYGRPILGDYYRALVYGPIPQRTMDALHVLVGDHAAQLGEGAAAAKRLGEVLEVDHRYSYARLGAKITPNLDSLSLSELRALEHIVAEYGKRSFDDLKVLTHAMPAYRKAWEQRGTGLAVDMDYEDFFEEDPDAITGAREEMLENDVLRQAFPAQQ
jgi:uncharacterized phage-associated protein